MCEYYIGHGLRNDFPDLSIAVPGSESTLKIGYDYGHLVTGEKLQIEANVHVHAHEANLDEEAVRRDDDQIVPDPLGEKSMVVTTAEVHFC